MFTTKLQNEIKNIIFNLYNIELDVALEFPTNASFGDLACTAPLSLAKSLKRAPMDIANEIKDALEQLAFVELSEITCIAPGFINFKYSDGFYNTVLQSIVEQNNTFGYNSQFLGQKIIIEYTDPNPFKVFHIGHLMTNCIGESLACILEANGANVKRANYQGDVGLHVAKSLWGIFEQLRIKNITLEALDSWNLDDVIDFFGQSYSYASNASKNGTENLSFEEVLDAQKELNILAYVSAQKLLMETEGWTPLINYPQILNLDSFTSKYKLDDVYKLYTKGRQLSLDYFETLYKRLGTKFDYYFFESLLGEYGLEIVKKGLADGIFDVGENGAIIFKGEDYDLHSRVFVNSYGLPTYESKDLGLAKLKYSKFAYDKSYVVTGNEINEYFKVINCAMTKVAPELAPKCFHLGHGMMRFKDRKMSSRTGDVVGGDELLNMAKNTALAKMQEEGSSSSLSSDQQLLVADQVAVASIKYSVLKINIGQNISYDQEATLALSGNTGPYLQYTHARCCSILENESQDFSKVQLADLNEAELSVLRNLSKFENVVYTAGTDLTPNTICTYLYELAQSYNSFYNANRILDAPNPQKLTRVMLTAAVKIVMANGLRLLGIPAPTQM
ncbi:MAG: arginine--tRNA ligase [Patescibacteria group bacterium]